MSRQSLVFFSAWFAIQLAASYDPDGLIPPMVMTGGGTISRTGDAPAPPRDFYIDALAGDDAHEGSAGRPWRGIARANALDLNPGDRLLFRAGQSFTGNLTLSQEDAGTSNAPVVLTSWGGGQAHIEAGEGTGVRVINAGGVTVENLRITGAGPDANAGSGVRFENTLLGAVKLEHVVISNVVCSGFGGQFGKERNEFGAVGQSGEGIFVGGTARDRSKSGFRHVRITDCVAHNNEYFGIYISGAWDAKSPHYANEDVTITRCDMYHNLGDPDYLDNHSGSGLLMEDVAGGLIEHCRAWENGARCRSKAGGPCGIWAAVATRVTIEHCESWRNRTGHSDGDGFDFDGGVTDSVMRYNLAWENEGAGILLYTYAGSPHTWARNLVHHNLCVNNATKGDYGGISIGNHGGGWEGGVVCHNTIITARDHPSNSGLHIIAAGKSPGIVVANNLVVSRGVTTLLNAAMHPDLRVIGNAWWADDGQARFRFEGKSCGSLEELRTVTGVEQLGNRARGFEGNPGLETLDLPPDWIAAADSPKADPHRFSALKTGRLRANASLAGKALPWSTIAPGYPVPSVDFYQQPVSRKPVPGAGSGED